MELKERVLTHLRDLYEDDPEMAEESTTEIQSMLDCAHDPCTIEQVREVLAELEGEGKVLSTSWVDDASRTTWVACGSHVKWDD